MPSEAGADLPSELIKHIALSCLELDKDSKPVKRGLASCSLVCRYWANLIRPDLFQWLTLRGPDDTSQLLQFVRTPHWILECTVGDIIKGLTVVDNHKIPSSFVWSGQLVALQQLRRLCDAGISIHYGVSHYPSDPDPGSIPCARHRTSLPLPTLLRTLPGSIAHFNSLSLRHLQLPSFKKLEDCAQNLSSHTASTE